MFGSSNTPRSVSNAFNRRIFTSASRFSSACEALEPPVVRQMREILLAAKNRADAGELTPLKTY
ncbi:hypothetical protein SAMN05443247_09372 [Bradyrhizobium erythrophlei]|nr:hypothetical protein SAMN05443247_09372 [Bradyrhizobium erythrophlei]